MFRGLLSSEFRRNLYGVFIHGAHSKQSSEFKRMFFLDSSQDLIYKQQRAEGPMASLAQGNTLRT